MPPGNLATRDSGKLDVAIIGAGAIGLAIAYSLRTMDGNCRIAVIEKDPSYALASTPRASGGVRRLFTLPENIELSNHSIPVYEKFHELMAVNADVADIGFKKGGYLFIVPPMGVATLARNFERQRRHGVNVEWLAPDKLKERFPSMHVADLGAAVQSHDDGWLDPYAVLMGFRRKVKSLGVELIDDAVMGIEREGRLVRSLTLKSGRKLKPAPDRSFRCKCSSMGSPRCNTALDGGPDVVERLSACLKSLDLEKALQVELAVVAPPSNTERRGNQTFLHVIPHRASGDVSQIGQVLNGVPHVDSHAT